jgi:hypothetical protein
MFNRELPTHWSDAIIIQDATILAIPINLLRLLIIQESGEFGRRGKTGGRAWTLYIRHSYAPGHHDASAALPVPSPGSSAVPPPAPAGRQSSPPSLEDPADLHSYIAWFKLREPLLVVLRQREEDSIQLF